MSDKVEIEAKMLTEVRCPECNRLLFRGRLLGEIRCARCKTTMIFVGTERKRNVGVERQFVR